MASIPVAGFPKAEFFTPPGRRRNAQGHFIPKGQILTFVGIEDFAEGLEAFGKNVGGPAKKAALTEIGLFGSRETKLRTPVKYGVLRASIGQFTSEDLAGGGVFGPQDASEAQAAAHFDVSVNATGGTVEWGTNIEYAPWIEDGFTMDTRRAVWFDDVQGFRMVNPFSYRGAHMFAQAAQVTGVAVPHILAHYIEQAAKASELT